MAVLDEVVRCTSFDDAAAVVVDVLGPGAAVWHTTDGGRELVCGQPTDRPSAAVTGLCRGTVEVTADADPLLVEAAATLLAGANDRIEIEDRARRARRRLADSERIGMTGTYAWSIRTGELEWTDGLIRIYGYEPGEFEPTYERFLEAIHPDDRERIQAIHEHALRTGEPFEMEERIVRPDGEVRTLTSIGEVSTDGDGEVTGIVGVCRDITEQREAERRVADADLRRRQALEVNDNVIQGLVSLLWQLEDDAGDDTRRSAEAILAASRRMVTDLLKDADDVDTGNLVRQSPAELAHDGSIDVTDVTVPVEPTEVPDHLVPAEVPGGRPTGPLTVVIADDLPTLRTLLRMRLSQEDDIEVVAEACDGQEAVDLVIELQPDVVVVDLSMPVLDGLQATRRIRKAAPATRVIVLSGYPAESMAADARAAGAERYIEKSSDLAELCAAITMVEASGDLGP